MGNGTILQALNKVESIKFAFNLVVLILMFPESLFPQCMMLSWDLRFDKAYKFWCSPQIWKSLKLWKQNGVSAI